jgi:molybdenum cofactor synthesis domain-containing protein
VLDLETALSRVLAALPSPRAELIPLTHAAGRVATESVLAPTDLPLFDNSAMDGYAVRADDVRTARADAPVRLRIEARIPAGEFHEGALTAGECARLFTGSPMPRGADAVVMQEDTRVDASQPGEVLICDSAKTGENVRAQGEDLQRGTMLLDKGAELTAAAIALLGATGISQVSVGTRPVIGLLATGSELREPGEPLSPGQIFESNRAMLSPLVAGAGGIPQLYPIIPDTLQATRAALERAFDEGDCVITSGGVSVGEMDFVKAAFEALGGQMSFWKVADKSSCLAFLVIPFRPSSPSCYWCAPRSAVGKGHAIPVYPRTPEFSAKRLPIPASGDISCGYEPRMERCSLPGRKPRTCSAHWPAQLDCWICRLKRPWRRERRSALCRSIESATKTGHGEF